jgi:2-polyprenyl-3-methyl-5-hydroxy-6-metoxy-1,4-benzoquinol methylase
VSDETWKRVREVVTEEGLALGSYFSFQALNDPGHLLFTLSRYKFASKMLPWDSPVDVLELGCAEGFGTLFLAVGGHKVTAVDFDQAAIDHARKTIKRPNILFQHTDFMGRKLGSFQAVISLDVIEHIPHSEEKVFVQTVSDNMDENGFCIIGTPNETAKEYASKASKIGHVNLFTGERLRSLMAGYFKNVFMFGMNDEVLHTGFPPMCHYLIALCSGKSS